MSFSEMSKDEAVRLIEAKIKGEEICYSSIVNEAVRMIKEEREKVKQIKEKLKQCENLLTDAHDLMDDVHCYNTEIYQDISKYFKG